jgi:hypothetical protein
MPFVDHEAQKAPPPLLVQDAKNNTLCRQLEARKHDATSSTITLNLYGKWTSYVRDWYNIGIFYNAFQFLE